MTQKVKHPLEKGQIIVSVFLNSCVDELNVASPLPLGTRMNCFVSRVRLLVSLSSPSLALVFPAGHRSFLLHFLLVSWEEKGDLSEGISPTKKWK